MLRSDGAIVGITKNPADLRVRRAEEMRRLVLAQQQKRRACDAALLRDPRLVQQGGHIPTGSFLLNLLVPRNVRDRKSTRLNSRHSCASRMPSSACKKKIKNGTESMFVTRVQALPIENVKSTTL